MGITRGIYKHFKGEDYLVIGVAKHSETREDMVVYLELHNDYQMSVRPLKMFTEEVDKPEFNYKGPRFKLIKEI